jgi:Pyruvate kinase, alpha/beta domain
VQVHASLIVVLTRGGSTARLVAKYRPSIPVLTVAVPVLTTDSLTWSCSGMHLLPECASVDRISEHSCLMVTYYVCAHCMSMQLRHVHCISDEFVQLALEDHCALFR